MALHTFECNCLTPLHFKGLKGDNVTLTNEKKTIKLMRKKTI